MNSKNGALAVAGLLLALCGSGCWKPEASGRVLLIGIDGATPKLLFPWIESRELPHLAELARNGTSGNLKSHFPLLSPRIWTSIATGKLPDKHGITSWVVQGAAGLQLVTGKDRKVPALWNILSASHRRVAVVNWLDTQPPEQIDGVMVSDFAIPGERKGREAFGAGFATGGHAHGAHASSAAGGEVSTYPIDWIKNVKRLIAEDEPLTHFKNPFEDDKTLPSGLFLPMLSRTFHNDDLIARIALEIDRTQHPDVMMVYFPGIDRTSHLFWGAYEPDEKYPPEKRFTPSQKGAAGRALWNYYRYTDALIGKLTERYGPDDLVLVVSDHGFEAVTKKGSAITGSHDSLAAVHGVLLARGRGITPGSQSGCVSVNDITPTILAYLGMPIAKDMDGTLASFLYVPELQSIASYDDIPVVHVGTTSETTEKKIIQDLRSLGYVE